MNHCRFCKRWIPLDTKQKQRIREFKSKYPWVIQEDLARLFDLSTSRISEILLEK